VRPPSECIQPTSTRAQANLTLQGTVVIVVRAIPSDLIIEFPSRLLLPVPTFPPSSPPARVSAPAAAHPLGSRSMRPQATALAVAHTFRGRAHFEARRSRFAPAIIAAVVAMWCAVRAASTVLACLNMASSSSHASVMLASSRLESTFHQHQVEGFCLVCLGVAVSFFPRRCRRLAKTGIVLVWHGHFGLFASLPGG